MPNRIPRPAADPWPERRSFAATALFFLLFAAWVGEWPLELDDVMYTGRWRSPFIVFGPLFEPLPGIRLFTWQVLLILLIAPVLAARAACRERTPEFERAILVSVFSVILTVLWGAIKGGSLYFAYYQVWRFLAALLLGYLLAYAIRRPADLAALGKMIVVAALIRGTLVIYFYWEFIRDKVTPKPEYMTNHDDSLLFVMAVLVTGGWALINGGRKAWVIATTVTLYLFYAMMLNDRRIAWVELILASAAIYLLIGPGPVRQRINKLLLGIAPVLAVYVIAGMAIASRGESTFFSPVQALTSVKSGDDPSSLTRQEELRNLLYTLTTHGNPLFGTGWGRPYEIVERIWSNYNESWILVPYTPHNSLVGLATFSGLVGVIGMWGIVPLAAWLGAIGYRNATEPVPRVAAAVAVGTLVAYSVHCYGDIGLQSFACCTMFGAALGVASRVAAWRERWSPAPQEAAPPAAYRPGAHATPARPLPRPAGRAPAVGQRR